MVLTSLFQASSSNTAKFDLAVQGFSGPPRHHVTPQPQPRPLPRALMEAEYVFVQDDASKPLLSLLYRGSYLVGGSRNEN